ncbi:MAG: NFACT family protein [Chloroflexota bacterium]|nr:NFACT family protein [Chloroflexota bacterium]
MFYDTLTMSAVRDEMVEHLLEGRVQRVVRPSRHALGLEIYAGERYQLLISAESRAAHMFLAEEKLRRGTETPSPLQLLMRKYVRGARLRALVQPPFERILRLTFEGAQGEVVLVCEIMGRLSNVILLDANDVIMGAVKPVPASVNPYRAILPEEPYVPPPPQDKENPLHLTPTLMQEIVEEETGDYLWRRLVQGVFGISPLLAREIFYRATGTVDPDFDLRWEHYRVLVAVTLDLMRLPETHDWSPCVAYEGEGEGRQPAVYAPYELTHLPDREKVASISVAISRVLKARESLDAYREVRARLHRLIDDQVERYEGRLASLQASRISDEELARLEAKGNAILAMIYSIQPGQQELVVDLSQFSTDLNDASDEPTAIRLDSALSPAENAQKFFEEYKKKKAAGRKVPRLIRRTKMDLAYLKQLRTEVDLAEDRPELDEVKERLEEAGYLPPDKKTRSTGQVRSPIRVRSEDDMLILVGRNSRQNDEVTFREAAPDDIWLHAHDVPGSHVVIKSGGAEVSEETLLLAARLAAYYSAARQRSRVQVDYTERRHVRHIRGGRPGMVTYRQEETIVVSPPKR